MFFELENSRMAKDWYVLQDGRVLGPYSSEKLKSMAFDGRVKSTSEVGNDRSGPWHPVVKLKGLTFQAEISNSRDAEVPPQIRQAVAESVTPTNTSPKHNHERDIWTGRPSQITNLRTFILCGLFCWLFVPVFIAVWRYLVVRTIRYELTSQRFRVSWGVLFRKTEELELYRVKDTAFSQSFFQLIFGLATVSMSSSDTSTPQTSIESIPAGKAKELREEIRNLVEELRDRKRVREIDYA